MDFTLDEGKYYDFFNNAGWVSSHLHTFGELMHREKSVDSLKECCEKASQNSSGDDKVAKQIIHSLPQQEVQKAILNGLACEHVRRKLGVFGKLAFVHGVIEHLFRSSVRRELAILRVYEAAPSKAEKIAKLIDNPDVLKRVEEMLYVLRDSNELETALSGLIRTMELKTHTWKAKPEAKHWEFTIIKKIRELPIWQAFVFTGAKSSIWKKDSGTEVVPQKERGLVRNEIELNLLGKIGGKELFLENPDGEKIHTMGFNAEEFRQYLRDALSGLECISEGDERVYKKPEKPSEAVENLVSLGILENKRDTFVLHMPQQGAKDGEPSTAILCTGSGVWFSVYKKMIARLLLNGVNVQTFSYRGYELSEGIPTNKKLFQDVETVGHYLREKGVPDKKTILYASCMGLGPSAMYVKNHPDVDIFIDRSFASLSAVAAHKIETCEVPIRRLFRPLASKVAAVALAHLIQFENVEPLQKSTGKIAVVTADEDEMVGEDANRLKSALDNAVHIEATRFGHSGNWLHNEQVREQFEEFLVESGHAKTLIL